jgi:hypothetical protein
MRRRVPGRISFWAGVAFAIVLPVVTLIIGGFSVGVLVVSWVFAGVFLWTSLKLRNRSNRHGHRASVTRVLENDGHSYYFALCDCGWIETPIDSSEAAFSAARKHTKDVAGEVTERLADAG